MGRTLLDRLEDEIDRIRDEADEKVRELVRPHIQAEFERVRKKCPRLERIIFGNGTYILVGIDSKIQWSYPRPFGNHYVQDNLTPKYLHKLTILCEGVEDLGMDEIRPLEVAA